MEDVPKTTTSDYCFVALSQMVRIRTSKSHGAGLDCAAIAHDKHDRYNYLHNHFHDHDRNHYHHYHDLYDTSASAESGDTTTIFFVSSLVFVFCSKR